MAPGPSWAFATREPIGSPRRFPRLRGTGSGMPPATAPSARRRPASSNPPWVRPCLPWTRTASASGCSSRSRPWVGWRRLDRCWSGSMVGHMSTARGRPRGTTGRLWRVVAMWSWCRSTTGSACSDSSATTTSDSSIRSKRCAGCRSTSPRSAAIRTTSRSSESRPADRAWWR